MKKYSIKLQINLAKYSIQLQTKLTALFSVSNATEDLTKIQTKLNKMKQLATQCIEEVRKTSEQEVAAIKESAGPIFLEHSTVYNNHMISIKDTCTNELTKQK